MVRDGIRNVAIQQGSREIDQTIQIRCYDNTQVVETLIIRIFLQILARNFSPFSEQRQIKGLPRIFGNTIE